MKALVTGAAGFIGSHLVEALKRENVFEEIIGVDDFSLGKRENIKCKLITGKVQHMGMSQVQEFDQIFNLAVHPLPESLIDPSKVISENIEILTCLLEAMRTADKPIHMVHVSSSEVYGTMSPDEKVIEETHPMNPTTPYAASKAACDLLVQSYVRTFGLDVTIARPFNTYGQKQNDDSYAAVIPTTIKRIMNGQRPIITGTGQQTRDFSYVTDIVNGIIKVARDGKRGEAYNLCSWRETSILELVVMIANEMKWEGGYDIYPDRSADVLRHQGSYLKLSQLVSSQPVSDCKPKVFINEGIKKTIEYYKSERRDK